MKKKRKLNNKGVTLIELLVGVAILGVIIGPLLAGFMMSTRTNAHSKQMGMATTAAQNVMEKIRGLKLTEDIVQKLTPAKTIDAENIFSDAFGDSSEGAMIIDSALDVASARYKWSDALGSYVNSSNAKVDPIRFVEKTEVNGRDYIAEVEIKRAFSSVDGEGNETDAAKKDEYTDYNNETFTSITSMNSKMDCSFLQTSTMDNAALELFSVYDREDVKNHMTRKMIVTIGGNDLTAVDPTDVTVQIEYTYNSMTKRLFPEPKHISGKIDSTLGLRNVFIYYTPYTPDDKYIGIPGGEEIEIVNKAHVDGVGVYIVCQNSEKQGNKINYTTYKTNSPTISLIEDEPTASFSGKVYTNVRVGDSLFVDGDDKQIEDVFKYKINTKDVIGGDSKPAKDAIGVKSLAAETISDKAYDVTVRVYPLDKYTVAFYEEFINGTETHFSESVDTITGAKERQ